MNFQEAEKTYRDLKAQHDAGKVNDTTFETEVGKLRLQDEQGRWWQIGVQTGEWYVHDGQKWIKSRPPAAAPAPQPAPVAPAPVVTAPPAAPAPKPNVLKAEAAPPKPEPAKTGQRGGGGLPARLFSAKPAGRNGGGISTPLLIGIIVGVAVIGALILIGGYLLLSGGLGGTAAKPTTTPTRALAALPTAVMPTAAPPTLRPTDTPLAPPTPIITATIPLTVTAPTSAPRPAGPSRTPTKRPGTPAPAASATPNVPPGVYAIKLETDPAKLSTDPSVQVAFKFTVFNNTGGMQTFTKWFVRVFQCPEQCEEFKNSYGESLKFDVNIDKGTTQITTPPHVNFGPGRCEYIAIPYYTDGNSQAIQFQTTKGGALYYRFSVCN